MTPLFFIGYFAYWNDVDFLPQASPWWKAGYLTALNEVMTGVYSEANVHGNLGVNFYDFTKRPHT